MECCVGIWPGDGVGSGSVISRMYKAHIKIIFLLVPSSFWILPCAKHFRDSQWKEQGRLWLSQFEYRKAEIEFHKAARLTRKRESKCYRRIVVLHPQSLLVVLGNHWIIPSCFDELNCNRCHSVPLQDGFLLVHRSVHITLHNFQIDAIRSASRTYTSTDSTQIVASEPCDVKSY